MTRYKTFNCGNLYHVVIDKGIFPTHTFLLGSNISPFKLKPSLFDFINLLCNKRSSLFSKELYSQHIVFFLANNWTQLALVLHYTSCKFLPGTNTLAYGGPFLS
jgi:hypothetical protein